MSHHEHRFDLQLGPDGHGQLYGNYEGYVHRCCGVYAPDVRDWLDRRHKQRVKEARELIAKEDA